MNPPYLVSVIIALLSGNMFSENIDLENSNVDNLKVPFEIEGFQMYNPTKHLHVRELFA